SVGCSPTRCCYASYLHLCCADLFTPATYIYTLSLHDALPIWAGEMRAVGAPEPGRRSAPREVRFTELSGPEARSLRAHVAVSRADRKSTRLNSSHQISSYAVFCLKKKITRRRLER